jgi:DNA-binding HxlR family transcriptional regulator
MSAQVPAGPRRCEVADALAVIGDRWSLLVIRELVLDVHRFGEIRANTGAPREILTARLRKLEREGVITRRPYQQRPLRHEYHLTESGEALRPILKSLRQWGRRHARATPLRCRDETGADHRHVGYRQVDVDP